jgi:hypothetical protein
MSVRNNLKTRNGVYYFHSLDVFPGNVEQDLLKTFVAGRMSFNECRFMKWNLSACDVQLPTTVMRLIMLYYCINEDIDKTSTTFAFLKTLYNL